MKKRRRGEKGKRQRERERDKVKEKMRVTSYLRLKHAANQKSKSERTKTAALDFHSLTTDY